MPRNRDDEPELYGLTDEDRDLLQERDLADAEDFIDGYHVVDLGGDR